MAGHITRLGNNRYKARFPVAGRGRFTSKTFTRRIDAEKWLNAQNAKRDRGDWVDPRRAGELFSVTVEAWMRSRRTLADATRARDESVMASLVLPYLGDLELRHITPERLDGWVQELVDRDKAATTIRKAFQLVSNVLSRAVTLRKLPANPAKVGEGISLPKVKQKEMRFLSVEEVGAVASVVADRYRALILTAAFTGLRWGELAGLRSKHLDLKRKRLTVAQTLSDVRGVVSFKAPKSQASKRSVAIPSALATELAKHLDRWPAVGDGLVFTGPEGGPLRRGNFRRRVWLPAVAEVLETPCRFHDLRHTHAAWLIEQGEHVKTIQSRLGHASIATTMDRYGHLMPGMDEAAADRLGEALFERVKHARSTPSDSEVINLR